jgi:hypothetical protein|tara:strand:+ start:57 stop:830 length:774 start_codon:yes stop_codon:yes gene_type:complete
MKNIISMLLLISSVSSQHIVKLKKVSINQYLKGKAEIVEADKTVRLKTSSGMKFLDISTIREISEKNGTIIWTFEEYNDRMTKEAFKVLCETNKDKKLLFISLKDDLFGLSDELHSFYDSTCYKITDRYEALEYFEKNKIQNKDINDYHLLNAGKNFEVDFVITGYVYQFDVPFKYSPTTTDPNSILGQIDYDDKYFNFENITKKMFASYNVYSQKNNRDEAISLAGSYVNLTLFVINVKTGKKEFLMKNKTVLKLG